MGRQPCCDKVGLKKGPWTSEEDKKLINFILTNGHCCWRAVPKLAGLLRCGKSCRLRWTNYLRPDLKRGLLSESEEQIVIDLHAKLGNRWSKIAANLPGRTDNEIKNHWNTHIKKKLKKMGIDPQTHKPLDSCDGGGQRGEEQMAEVGAGAGTASKKFPRSTGEVEEWKSQSFCTDEVPVILPEEMMVPPASTVTSISPSSPSSSSINSAKVEENQLACINWSESIPWWILDESEGWDLLWDHSEGGLAVEDPFSDYGSSVLDQDSWSFSLQ